MVFTRGWLARKTPDRLLSGHAMDSRKRRPTMVRVVPMCELCRRVRDEGASTWGTNSWVDFPSYLARHVVPPSQVRFSRDYCSECRLSYDILKTYGEQ